MWLINALIHHTHMGLINALIHHTHMGLINAIFHNAQMGVVVCFLCVVQDFSEQASMLMITTKMLIWYV